MDPLYVQIGVAAATVLGSGVVSAAVNHRFTTNRAEKEFLRKKMEELFLAFHGYCTQISVLNLIWPRVMKGEVSYNEALESNANVNNRWEASFENVEMLISLYFPDLAPGWKKVLDVRDQMNRMKGDFKKRYQIAGPDQAFVEPFWDALLSLETAEKSFKDELRARAKTL